MKHLKNTKAYQEYRDTKKGGILISLILVIIIVVINIIGITILSLHFGFKTALFFGSILIAPFVEEWEKKLATKIGIGEWFIALFSWSEFYSTIKLSSFQFFSFICGYS